MRPIEDPVDIIRGFAQRQGWSEAKTAEHVNAYLERRRVIVRRPGERQNIRVYVITDEGGFVKVGVSNDPTARLKGLQAANPRALALAFASDALWRRDAMRVEALAHSALRDHHVRNEWFACSAADALTAIKMGIETLK